MEDRLELYETAANWIGSRIPEKPKTAAILGSGLGFMTDLMTDQQEFAYQQIPGFPEPTVKTHAGKLVWGRLQGRPVLMMKGRYHYYEGHSMQDVVMPVRVMKLLGVENLIVTNAAGGINPSFDGGTVMLIRDHIKLMADSPLRGMNYDSFGVRFPDMTTAYDSEFLKIAADVAKQQGIVVQQGVYAYATGPQYETPAEVRAFGLLGADAVGMSTAPEVIAANHCGMRVLGISCITNMAAGLHDKPLDDEEVNRVANANADKLSKLVLGVLEQIG